MTDTATLTSLDDHRARTVPTVVLNKGATVPAPVPVVHNHDQEQPPAEDGTQITDRREARRLARAARRVHAAATHERTRTSLRLAVRHTAYVWGGAGVVTKRAWDGRTVAVHHRMRAMALAAGDTAAAADWQDKADKFRAARHARRMDLITRTPHMVQNAAIGAAGVEGALLLLGVCMAVHDRQLHDVVVPTLAAIDAIRAVCWFVGVAWGPALALMTLAGLAHLWRAGQKGETAPTWARPAAEGEQRDVVPDEGAILAALKHLGIGPLNQAVKEGWQPRWISPTTRMGKGWHTQLQLPMGVTVEMVNAKKNVLAHNLMRLPIEVWPTEPSKQPGILDLWVADQGSTSGPVPDWPLLTDGESDYFKGVPVGVSQRGEPVFGQLMASNYMVGGIMGSGKSSLVISLLLGAMLDPLVEIEAYVMAYNVDYDPMRPRLRRLVKGDEDEQVEAALEALRALRDEVTLRGKILEDLGGEETKLTRKLAQQDPRMRPKVVVFDECHELFEHKEFGEEAAELAVKVMKKARKVGITLIWVTVSPTASSIPKDVTRNTSHRVAFAVGDHVANDGLLGTGKHRAGITATTLNPAENVGTALTVGFTKNPFELIRSYYVRKDATTDQVSPVVARALALREGVTPAAAPVPAEEVDHLADVVDVLGEAERMRSDEVRQRLAERAPSVYRSWTASDLTQALRPFGAEPRKYNGIQMISRARVLAALETRAEEAEDTGEIDGE